MKNDQADLDARQAGTVGLRAGQVRVPDRHAMIPLA